ncbi:hypothetical protein ACFWP2_21955 [Kitasatospora sp. NPDC058444]|uniref:hypothetical protein n=1 Tax=Kitasatospora sp. NPDC058444 TaxID=3346504 RepID=UPI00364B2D63
MWVISQLAPNRYIITDVRDHNACLTSADAPVVQPCSLSDDRQKWEITRYEPEPGRYGMVGRRGEGDHGGGRLAALQPTGRRPAVRRQLRRRLAEFHDGNGWGLWAHGTLPGGTRFWTAINDQPANPWS